MRYMRPTRARCASSAHGRTISCGSWATTWTQWIFDNNLVDHTSVAWIPAAASSTAPILGTNQRYREVRFPLADAQ